MLGNIGSASTPITFTAKNGIQKISGNAAWATITTNANGGAGDLGYLVTTGGDFVGTINTTDIEASSSPKGLDIAGNLDANINCSGQVKAKIAIDGAILSGRTITTAANGVTDQIILNQDNNNFLWLGDVRIGGSTGPLLSPKPYYDNAPSALGGGAVGLAPFMVHYEACNPVAAGDPVTPLGACTAHATSPGPLTKVSITHYGPVGLWDGTTTGGVKNILSANPPTGIEGFTVEVADDTNCTWVPVTDSFVTKYIGGNHRTFDIEGPFTNGPCFVNKYYRIKPVQAYVVGNRFPLVCRDVDGNPVAGDYEYIVKIEPPDCSGWGGN